MRPRRAVIAIIALIIILPVLGLLVFILAFNPNRYAPDLVAAVSRATGRQLVLGGPIHLKLSFAPTIEASDVSLANPPGFADPNLLTLERLEARVSLLPLLSHRLDINDLVLVGPHFNFERNQAGQADWDLSPAAAGPGAASGGMPAQTSHGYKVTLESVEIQNGLVTIKNPNAAQTTTLALTEMTGTADSGTAPLNVTAQAAYDGTPFTVSGVVGPVARLSGLGAGPWPVNLALSMAGATASVNGSIAEPRSGRGYDVTVTATIPALEVLAPVLAPDLPSGFVLPPLHGITGTAQIVDQNSAIPAIDSLSIKAGPSDLSGLRPGLSLTALDVEMASLNKPFEVSAFGASSGAALEISGNFGAVQSLFNPALLPASMPPQGSFAVAIQAQAGDAKLGVTGAIATPAQLAGVALAVNLAVPDLSALSAAAGMALPAWKNIQVQTTLIDPGGLGLRKAAGLDSLVLGMDDAALGGAASLYFGAQPRLQAAFHAQQLDLDAVLAAIPASQAQPTSAAAPIAAPATTQSSTPPPDLQSSTPPPDLMIPTAKLPLGLLRTASADIQLSADSLVFNKVTYTAMQGHAVLAGGVLSLSPVTGQLPGGSVSASANLDASKDPAQASLSMNAPALALSPFLKAVGLPDTAQGTMQASMNISGTGDSLHDMASTMNGQLGIASVNGIIDGRVLDQLFGAVLQVTGLPEGLVGTQGPVSVRCFGLRVDASNGVGTVRALTLDSSRLLVQGGGTINFGPETLAVVLRPQVPIAGNPVGVPVEIGGTFASPTDTLAPQDILKSAASAASGLADALAGRIGGTNSLLGNVVAAVGVGGATDVCPDALSLGRLGQPGPAAPPVSAVSAPGSSAPPVSSGPKSLLNSLFGK